MKIRDFLKEFEGRDPDAELAGVMMPLAGDVKILGVANRAEFAKFLDVAEAAEDGEPPDTVPTGLEVPKPGGPFELFPEQLPAGQSWNDTYIIFDAEVNEG